MEPGGDGFPPTDAETGLKSLAQHKGGSGRSTARAQVLYHRLLSYEQQRPLAHSVTTATSVLCFQPPWGLLGAVPGAWRLLPWHPHECRVRRCPHSSALGTKGTHHRACQGEWFSLEPYPDTLALSAHIHCPLGWIKEGLCSSTPVLHDSRPWTEASEIASSPS